MKIFLIRHGESQQNSDNVLSGVTDVPLSENGKKQCQKLAILFNSIQIDAVYATPLKRSRESAEIIFPSHRKSIQVIKSLTEINYGKYEGYKRVEYGNVKDPIIQKWLTEPSSVTFPSGDNVQNFAEKALKSINHLARENEGGNIACILHRTIIRLIIAQIIGLPLDKFRSIPCSNCGISEISYQNGKWQLDSLNNTFMYSSP